MKDEPLHSKAHYNVENSVPKKKFFFCASTADILLADIAQENQSCNNSSQINAHSTTTT
jgi:hypothetical protein